MGGAVLLGGGLILALIVRLPSSIEVPGTVQEYLVGGMPGVDAMPGSDLNSPCDDRPSLSLHDLGRIWIRYPIGTLWACYCVRVAVSV